MLCVATRIVVVPIPYHELMKSLTDLTFTNINPRNFSHQINELRDVDHGQDPEHVLVHGGDVPQEDDLRVLEVVVGVRQHLVEAVEEQLDRVAEAVVRLADRGADEEEAGADDELDDVLDRLEALLDRVMS